MDATGTTDRTLTVAWEDPLATAARGAEMSGIDRLRAITAGTLAPPPMAQLMSMRLSEVDEGHAVFEVEPAEHHYNPIGVVHGGLAMTLADSAMGCAVQRDCPRGRDRRRSSSRSTSSARSRATPAVRSEGTVIHVGSASPRRGAAARRPGPAVPRTRQPRAW